MKLKMDIIFGFSHQKMYMAYKHTRRYTGHRHFGQRLAGEPELLQPLITAIKQERLPGLGIHYVFQRLHLAD